MICPAVRTTRSFSDADILSVFSSDHDIVNEVPLTVLSGDASKMSSFELGGGRWCL